jgi:hypothetical protein
MGDSGVGNALSLAHPRRQRPSALASQGEPLEPGVRRTRLRGGIGEDAQADVILLIYNDHGGAHFSRQLIDGAKGLAQMPNIEYVREAASEGIELVM